jgi:hypothetical protein
MKRIGNFFLVFCILCFAGYAHADVSKGRLLLFNNGNPTTTGIVAAKAEFSLSVQSNPSDQQANFFLAVSRMPALMDNTAVYSPGLPIDNVKEILDLFGVSASGRDVFNWAADFTRDVNGNEVIPIGAPSGPPLQDFMLSRVIPEIDAALSNLSVCTASFNTLLTPAETGESYSVEVDYGDVLILRSHFHAAKATLLGLCSYDSGADPVRVAKILDDKLGNLNSNLISLYPQLLKVLPGASGRIGAARSAALTAIDEYLEASAFIRAETDDQSNDLFAIEPDQVDKEAHLRSQLTEAKESILTERTAAFTNGLGTKVYYANANHLFGTGSIPPVNPRALIPYFDEKGNIHTGTFPDTTMDGILVDCLTELQLVEFSPVHLPIVFPIPDRTMVMDGSETDWQQVAAIPKSYFASTSRSQDIDLVKVSKDQNYVYWMVKHVTPIQSGRYYYFSLSGDAPDGRFSVGVNIQSNGIYSIYASPSGTNYSGSSADYRISSYFLEGRIPKSMLKLVGPMGVNYYTSHTSGYNASIYDSAIITAATLPLADAGSDQIISATVTLDGTKIYPAKNIISWEWTLRHRTNTAYNRTASGQKPTVSGLGVGFYDVTLTVMDDSAKTYTDTMLLVATGTGTGQYTQQQLDQAVLEERQKWDAGGDGKVGLEEAIRALQVTSGAR